MVLKEVRLFGGSDGGVIRGLYILLFLILGSVTSGTIKRVGW